MLTIEQKAAAWDRLKKVWEKGRDDEENDTESRDICRVLAEQMQVIEEKVSRKGPGYPDETAQT